MESENQGGKSLKGQAELIGNPQLPELP